MEKYFSWGILYRIMFLCAGRSTGISHTNAASRYPHTAVGRSDKLADDWDRELAKHRMTLNGTQFMTSRHEPERQSWPCVDNTSCEIQLSLVEQQQKLLNQKKQASTKLQTSLHTGLRNGHSDTQVHSVLNSLDNKPVDGKCISHQPSAVHSKSQPDFAYRTDLYRGVGSRNGWSGSVDLNRNNQGYATVLAHISASNECSNPDILGKQHSGKHDLDATEEQTRKKQKRLQHLQGSRKSGTTVLCICLTLYMNAE